MTSIESVKDIAQIFLYGTLIVVSVWGLYLVWRMLVVIPAVRWIGGALLSLAPIGKGLGTGPMDDPIFAAFGLLTFLFVFIFALLKDSRQNPICRPFPTNDFVSNEFYEIPKWYSVVRKSTGKTLSIHCQLYKARLANQRADGSRIVEICFKPLHIGVSDLISVLSNYEKSKS